MQSPKSSLVTLKICKSGNNLRSTDSFQEIEPNPQQQQTYASSKLFNDLISQRQPVSSILIGDADTLFLTRENDKMEQEILQIIDSIEKPQQDNKVRARDAQQMELQIEKLKLQKQQMNKIIDKMKGINSKWIRLVKQKCKMVVHLVSIIKILQNTLNARKELQQSRLIQANYRRALEKFSKHKIDCQLQTQQAEKKLQISRQLSINIQFLNNSKVLSQKVLSDNQSIQKSLFNKNSSQNLTNYFKELSTIDKQISYNQKLVEDLEKNGENQASKAFARLLKQHMYLKLCLNRIMQKEHQQQETNNQRIVQQLKSNAKNLEKNEKVGKPGDPQCNIY